MMKSWSSYKLVDSDGNEKEVLTFGPPCIHPDMGALSMRIETERLGDGGYEGKNRTIRE